MLYISNYDKYNLDKSSQSMYAYYTRLINDINVNIIEIRDYLVNMLDVVANLRTRLYDIKASIQEDLDKTKDAYEEAGYTNSALDKVQEILDGAEEDLGNLEDKVTSTIEAIDCNEIPEGCNYVEDCAEGCSEAEEPVQPVEPPADCNQTGECNYCSYSVDCGQPGSGQEYCSVCNHSCGQDVCREDACFVDQNCSERVNPGNCNEVDFTPGCEHILIDDPNCGQRTEIDGTCMETAVYCVYDGNDYPVPDGCNFDCAWSGTECGEAAIPDGCTFHCDDDTLCNYDGTCGECTFTSSYEDPYCGETHDCNQSCVFDSDTCVYDSTSSCSYDSEAGFDYGCGEWAEDCREPTTPADCSEGSSDDDSNVVCTYLIKRLFDYDATLLSMSRENVKIGLRNGLPKKAFKEYYNGLGLEIIEHLKHETDDYLQSLWLNNIQPVWALLRTDPKSGVKAYTDFIINQADYYDIDWHKYGNINGYVNK